MGVLTVFYSSKDYPTTLRRVVVKDDERKANNFFDQQLRSQARVDCRLVPPALAGRIVFQMDQAAPAHQDVLWHQRERGQDANLDRSLHLRVDRNC